MIDLAEHSRTIEPLTWFYVTQVPAHPQIPLTSFVFLSEMGGYGGASVDSS